MLVYATLSSIHVKYVFVCELKLNQTELPYTFLSIFAENMFHSKIQIIDYIDLNPQNKN